MMPEKLRSRLKFLKAAQIVRVAFSSASRRRIALNCAMKHTKLTREELEKAQKKELLLPMDDCKYVDYGKVDLERQVDIIANLALPVGKKRKLRFGSFFLPVFTQYVCATFACMRACVCICVSVCVRACVRACVRVYIYIYNIYIYIYIYI